MMAKILLAEDDDSLRQFLEWELGKAGHDVFAVRDGREALPVLLGEKASALSPTAHSEMASRQWLDRGAPGEAG